MDRRGFLAGALASSVAVVAVRPAAAADRPALRTWVAPSPTTTKPVRIVSMGVRFPETSAGELLHARLSINGRAVAGIVSYGGESQVVFAEWPLEPDDNVSLSLPDGATGWWWSQEKNG